MSLISNELVEIQVTETEFYIIFQFVIKKVLLLIGKIQKMGQVNTFSQLSYVLFLLFVL